MESSNKIQKKSMTTPDETRSFDKGRVDIAKESRELEWMMVQKWNLVLVTLVIFHLDTMAVDLTGMGTYAKK